MIAYVCASLTLLVIILTIIILDLHYKEHLCDAPSYLMRIHFKHFNSTHVLVDGATYCSAPAQDYLFPQV